MKKNIQKKNIKKKIQKKYFLEKNTQKNNNKILMHIALLPSLKKIGLHLWQLLHGNGNKQQFWLIKGP